MENTYYAIISDHIVVTTSFGGCTAEATAYGTGISEESAWSDAAQWGIDDRAGYRAARITAQSYERILAGNPDAVEFAD